MKKTLYTLLVLLGLVSCSKDDVVREIAPKAISFGNVFVDKSTKAPTDGTYKSVEDLISFNVYGTVTGAVTDGNGNASTINIFNNVPVVNNVDSWVYDEKYTQYWVQGCSYEFVALADADCSVRLSDSETATNKVTTNDNEFGMPVSIEYDVRTQKDLLLAGPEQINGKDVTDNYDEQVNFTFGHLLSKAMFTFKNNFSQESGVVLKVTDITITDAPKIGTYILIDNTWNISSSSSGTTAVSFGDTEDIQPAGGTGECGNVSLLIPGTHTLNVTFIVNHNKGGKPTELSAEINDVQLLQGNSYNFTAELSSENVTGAVPVSFKTIAIGDFTQGNGENGSNVSW